MASYTIQILLIKLKKLKAVTDQQVINLEIALKVRYLKEKKIQLQ